MKTRAVLLCASLASCAEHPGDSPTWLGDACGVPDLRFSLDGERRTLVLAEYQVQGSEMSEIGLVPARTSDRQRLIERALPCLDREARRRGLGVEYPVVNVDG